MTYVVKFSAQAQQALSDIYLYIMQDKPRAAEKFYQELMDSCLSLDEFPLRNPRVPQEGSLGSKQEIRYISHRPYRIIYSIIGNRVTILDIRHGARQNV